MATVRSPVLASRAYNRVVSVDAAEREKYLSFARSFPTLIHTCGLAQATAFAYAGHGHQVRLLADLAVVMGFEEAADAESLQREVRETENLLKYQQLTRLALVAATWLKRYAEAVLSPAATQDADESSLKE